MGRKIIIIISSGVALLVLFTLAYAGWNTARPGTDLRILSRNCTFPGDLAAIGSPGGHLCGLSRNGLGERISQPEGENTRWSFRT